MFQNKNVVNRVSVFWKLVRHRYQDGSSMAEHMNAFQGLIHEATSLEVPLADEVLALLLLGSLPDSWETLVVTLGKSRLLDEEACQKDKDTSSDSKMLLTESKRGRHRNRSPQNREKSGTRSKSRGRPTCFYCGKPGHF